MSTPRVSGLEGTSLQGLVALLKRDATYTCHTHHDYACRHAAAPTLLPSHGGLSDCDSDKPLIRVARCAICEVSPFGPTATVSLNHHCVEINYTAEFHTDIKPFQTVIKDIGFDVAHST